MRAWLEFELGSSLFSCMENDDHFWGICCNIKSIYVHLFFYLFICWWQLWGYLFNHHPPLRKFKWREQTQFVPTRYQLYKNTPRWPAFMSKSPRARSLRILIRYRPSSNHKRCQLAICRRFLCRLGRKLPGNQSIWVPGEVWLQSWNLKELTEGHHQEWSLWLNLTQHGETHQARTLEGLTDWSLFLDSVGGGAWPFLVGGVICLVNAKSVIDSPSSLSPSFHHPVTLGAFVWLFSWLNEPKISFLLQKLWVVEGKKYSMS